MSLCSIPVTGWMFQGKAEMPLLRKQEQVLMPPPKAGATSLAPAPEALRNVAPSTSQAKPAVAKKYHAAHAQPAEVSTRTLHERPQEKKHPGKLGAARQSAAAAKMTAESCNSKIPKQAGPPVSKTSSPVVPVVPPPPQRAALVADSPLVAAVSNGAEMDAEAAAAAAGSEASAGTLQLTPAAAAPCTQETVKAAASSAGKASTRFSCKVDAGSVETKKKPFFTHHDMRTSGIPVFKSGVSLIQ